MFRANDRLDEFLAYIIRVREDPDAVLSPAPKDPETRDRERAMKNLFVLGSAMRVIEWSERRADELAPILLKLLGDKSAVMRRGAANLIGAAVVKVDLPDPARRPDDWLSRILSQVGQDNMPGPPKKDAPAEGRPQKSKVAVRLEKLNVEARLRELRDQDPDGGVRAAARQALERLAGVQEKKR
jgi:hypothetical protein